MLVCVEGARTCIRCMAPLSQVFFMCFSRNGPIPIKNRVRGGSKTIYKHRVFADCVIFFMFLYGFCSSDNNTHIYFLLGESVARLSMVKQSILTFILRLQLV